MKFTEPWLIAPIVVLTPAFAGLSPAYAQQYFTAEQAQRVLFPEAANFAEAALEISTELKARIQSLSGVRVRNRTQAIWKAEAGGRQIGWFVVDEVIGKHELITYALALDMSGVVRGLEIMDYRETHGGEVRNAKWRAQFHGKRQGAALALDEDIRNISGATLSCRHLTDGVKRLLALHEAALK